MFLLKRCHFAFFLATFLTVSQWSFAADTLRLTSFNIRLSSVDDGINNWNLRKSLLKTYVEKNAPDILGVQEALPNQISYLDSISNYEYVGVGRDNGMTLGEYCAIFYNSNKLEVRESGTFWLSETPQKPGLGWDAVCNRICTWAKFKDKSGKEFYVFNTHFDHMGVKARIESARLINSKIALVAPDVPVFFTGDLNTEDLSLPIEILKDFMTDSRGVALARDPTDGKSFNGFVADAPAKIKIDYIFTRDNIRTLSFKTNQDRPDGRFISDHYAVEGVYLY